MVALLSGLLTVGLNSGAVADMRVEPDASVLICVGVERDGDVIVGADADVTGVTGDDFTRVGVAGDRPDVAVSVGVNLTDVVLSGVAAVVFDDLVACAVGNDDVPGGVTDVMVCIMTSSNTSSGCTGSAGS